MNNKVFAVVLAGLGSFGVAQGMQYSKPYPLSEEQKEAFNKLVPCINVLRNNITKILDDADTNKLVTPKYGDELNDIERMSSTELDTGMPQLATKQGLIFYHNKLNFDLVTPKGTLTLGGYWGQYVVKSEDEQAIQAKVCALMELQPFPQYTQNTKMTWQGNQVYKVSKINGQAIPALVTDKYPDDSMYGE